MLPHLYNTVFHVDSNVQWIKLHLSVNEWLIQPGADPGGIMGVKRLPLPESYWESL